MADKSNIDVQAGPNEGPINVPIYRGSGFLISSAPTDSVVTILSVVPGINGGEFGVGASPIAAITMSHHALKECAVLLADHVAKIEAVHGELSTPWLSERAK